MTPRTRWLIVVSLGVAVGLAATLGVWALTSTGDDAQSPTGARRIGAPLRAGATVDPRALWLFGFDTVRVDPTTLDDARQLSASVFGAAASAGDRAFFYDAGSGAIGRLTATTSTFTSTAPLTSWDPPDDRSEIAATSGAIWAVTGVDRVARVDPETLTLTAETALPVPGATQTWVDADTDTAIAATATPTAVILTSLDTQNATLIQPDATQGAPHGVARAGDLTWIVQEHGATAVRGGSVVASVALPAAAGVVRAADNAGADLWVLADDGAAIYRLRADAPDDVERVPILAASPETFRAPVDLVADDTAVWVLVPTRTEPDRRDAVVARVDPRTAEVTTSLQLPTSLFAGALALTQ